MFAAGAGDAEVISGEQLAAELSVGRLTAHWSPLEDLEDMLLHVKPGEVKVRLPALPCSMIEKYAWVALAHQQLQDAVGPAHLVVCTCC